MVIKPIKVCRPTKLKNLPPHYRKAVFVATDGYLDADYDFDNVVVRLEKYAVKDIIYMIRNVWKWPVSINGISEDNIYREDDIERIKKICKLIKKTGVRWPYVSTCAKNIKQLKEIFIHENGEVSVEHHGDGWHRIIANAELGNRAIEILFIVKT